MTLIPQDVTLKRQQPFPTRIISWPNYDEHDIHAKLNIPHLVQQAENIDAHHYLFH